MNDEAALEWKRITANNIGESIAIVLDDNVFSYPVVQSEIEGGKSTISGNFSKNEANDLAGILNSGSLPVRLRLLEEKIIGPQKK